MRNQSRVERGVDRADSQGRQRRDAPLQAVLPDDTHALARLDSGAGQVGGCPVDPAVELSEGDRVAFEADDDLAWILYCPVAQALVSGVKALHLTDPPRHVDSAF